MPVSYLLNSLMLAVLGKGAAIKLTGNALSKDSSTVIFWLSPFVILGMSILIYF